MNCLKCGKAAQADAAFCMFCGSPLPKPGPANSTRMAPSKRLSAPVVPVPATGFAPAASVTRDFEQQKKRSTMIAIIIACLAALLAGGLALKSLGILGQNGRQSGDPLLTAKDRSPAASLFAPGGSAPPVLTAPGQVKNPIMTAPAEGMPDDIYNWLEHLRKTEEKRVDITMGQLTEAYKEKEKSQVAGGVDALKDLLNGIDDPNSEMHPPTEALAKLVKQMHDNTVDLQKDFDSYPPPAECVPIANAYDQALSETAGQMGDIADHIAAGDVDKLLKMENKSAQGIDSAGTKTDRLVGEICDKYHKRRWFTIATDIKSSPLFGSGF